MLDNEAFKQAMTALREQVIEQWKACPIRDKEGQTLLLQLAKLTDKFEGLIVGMVESGKFAQHRFTLIPCGTKARRDSFLGEWPNGYPVAIYLFSVR